MQGQIQDYKYVVHATEDARRIKYHGCVSRQTLRAQLRQNAQDEIRKQYPGENHKLVRKMAIDRSHLEYRALMGYDARV